MVGYLSGKSPLPHLIRSVADTAVPDLLIAATAGRHSVTVLHYDWARCREYTRSPRIHVSATWT